MSNEDLLTEEEFADYSPNRFLIDHLEACRARLGVEREAFRVVDWGCGRGALVLWLRQRGYPAVGVDIDERPFANGAELFRRTGHRPEDCLFGLDRSGTAPCPDASIHLVTSWQTLEHIEDLEQAASEMRRITVRRGEGVHVFPADHCLVEPHLFMPLVHWLPKNRLRKGCIAACVALGVEPRWWPDGGPSAWQKAGTYYRYSVDETFYRRPARIISCFEAAGFTAEFTVALGRRRLRALSQSPRPLTAWRTRLGPDVGLVTRRR